MAGLFYCRFTRARELAELAGPARVYKGSRAFLAELRSCCPQRVNLSHGPWPVVRYRWPWRHIHRTGSGAVVRELAGLVRGP